MDLDFSRMAGLAVGELPSAPRLMALIPCDPRSPIADPETGFLSSCFIASLEAAAAIVVVLPALFSIFAISKNERGQRTLAGLVAFVLACLSLLTRLTLVYFAQTISQTDIFVLVGGSVLAGLQYVQDGRVRVCSPEVLIYWLVTSATTLCRLVDSVSQKPLSRQLVAVDAFLFVLAISTLVLEAQVKRSKEARNFDTANAFELTSFAVLNPTLAAGFKGRLRQPDLIPAPGGLSAMQCYDTLRTQLEQYPPDSKYRVIFSLFKILKFRILAMFVTSSLSESMSYARPYILGLFLRTLTEYYQGRSNILSAIYFAILLNTLPVLSVAFDNITVFLDNKCEIFSRISLIGLIYEKALSLDPSAREEFETGKIMNLINVDTNMVYAFADVAPNIFKALIGFVACFGQLYLLFGWTMLAVIPIYCVYVPSTAILSRLLYTYYPLKMKVLDKRSKTTANIFRNIKSLKFYCWELPFYTKLADIRSKEELVLTRKLRNIGATLSALWSMCAEVVSAAVFICFLYFERGVLSPEVIFPAVSLLAYLSMPLTTLTFSLTTFINALTSQQRINELFMQKEQDHENYYHFEAAEGYMEESVSFDQATISWTGEEEDNKIALRDISLGATNGDLICIIGRVGSGKSAMLKALAGELKILSGSVTLKGNVAYCPQETWLQNKTIRENILFGLNYEEELYQATIKACDLESDLAVFPKKDLTEVGERGVSLSGGQRARVALARAVYSQADVYILDDVLSAVDQHVAAHLIKTLFNRDGLLSSKTIIMATNNINVLAHASVIAALESKRIVEWDTLSHVLQKDESTIKQLIEEFGAKSHFEVLDTIERKSYVSSKILRPYYQRPPVSESFNTAVQGQDEEEDDTGSAAIGIYKRFFEVASTPLLIAALVILGVSVLLNNSLQVLLGYIANQNYTNLTSAWPLMSLYTVLLVLAGLTLFFTYWFYTTRISLQVSRRLYEKMLWNTLRAPMSFFDTTPLGRVLNRFTGDIDMLDMTLPHMLYYFLRSSFNTVLSVVIVLIGSPIVIVVVIPLALLINSYRRWYIPGSRQISRMTSAANTPILAHIEESIKGASTVRAFGSESRFVDILYHHANYWVQCSFLRVSVRGWLSWRLEVASACFELVTAVTMAGAVYYGYVSIGFVGVVLWSAQRVGIMVRQIIAGWAQLEVSGVSLNRIFDFVDMEQERPDHIEDTTPPIDWPHEGTVKLDNFCTRYKGVDHDVLKNLSLSINDKEKIGIVGRTGSGKSTLTLALFRIVEATNGSIAIDNRHIAELGLVDLRSKLSIIPQDGQIFSGTLRENLDPFKKYDDAQLWQVLALCKLKDHFSIIGTGLDSLLQDGGDNLSKGQAQLICLGRALVNPARILVLDEATASVDVETDKIIQETIRTQFKDRTIITIAHRLQTIMDCDRVLFLEKGRVIELDSPKNLLEKKGAFYELCHGKKQSDDVCEG